MDNKKYIINVGGEEFSIPLPTSRSNAVAFLASAKFNNIGAILTNEDDVETYKQYRAWHTLCKEAVKDIDFITLNAAANEQIERERIAAEEEARAKTEAEAEAAKKAEEERKYYEEHIAPIERFNNAKNAKLAEIEAYDTSDAVNGFSINGMKGWLDRDTRTSLTNTVSIEKAAGNETTTLWFDGNALTLPCDAVLGMLAQLEMYAHKCYNMTSQHKANVMAMTDIEEIEAYDVTVGYPEQPAF